MEEDAKRNKWLKSRIANLITLLTSLKKIAARAAKALGGIDCISRTLHQIQASDEDELVET